MAFITGASRGIGKAVALAYAEEGADLMLLARQAGLLEAVADAARAKGVQALTFSADITDAEQVEAAMEVTERRYGRIDVLVNNAGIYRGAKFVDYDLETWNRVLQVNVNGTFICTQAALKRMVPRRSGKIVMMASTAGKYGSLYQAAYNASKHAVVGMTRCLALETAKQGITVNAICPGFVETDMIEALIPNAMKNAGIEDRQGMTQALLQRVPIGRFLQPEEIAHLAVYLASSESDGMTGQALTISGGLILV
ncbi:MAG: SDR family oxidoreductase [Candidatus Lambdaproteobacteria bacterium]|nr:SDR family oxidoreductase [Candidatus Lambdaproteobacteria bacterium]